MIDMPTVQQARNVLRLAEATVRKWMRPEKLCLLETGNAFSWHQCPQMTMHFVVTVSHFLCFWSRLVIQVVTNWKQLWSFVGSVAIGSLDRLNICCYLHVTRKQAVNRKMYNNWTTHGECSVYAAQLSCTLKKRKKNLLNGQRCR